MARPFSCSEQSDAGPSSVPPQSPFSTAYCLVKSCMSGPTLVNTTIKRKSKKVNPEGAASAAAVGGLDAGISTIVILPNAATRLSGACGEALNILRQILECEATPCEDETMVSARVGEDEKDLSRSLSNYSWRLPLDPMSVLSKLSQLNFVPLHFSQNSINDMHTWTMAWRRPENLVINNNDKNYESKRSTAVQTNSDDAFQFDRCLSCWPPQPQQHQRRLVHAQQQQFAVVAPYQHHHHQQHAHPCNMQQVQTVGPPQQAALHLKRRLTGEPLLQPAYVVAASNLMVPGYATSDRPSLQFNATATAMSMQVPHSVVTPYPSSGTNTRQLPRASPIGVAVNSNQIKRYKACTDSKAMNYIQVSSGSNSENENDVDNNDKSSVPKDADSSNIGKPCTQMSECLRSKATADAKIYRLNSAAGMDSTDKSQRSHTVSEPECSITGSDSQTKTEATGDISAALSDAFIEAYSKLADPNCKIDVRLCTQYLPEAMKQPNDIPPRTFLANLKKHFSANPQLGMWPEWYSFFNAGHPQWQAHFRCTNEARRLIHNDKLKRPSRSTTSMACNKYQDEDQELYAPCSAVIIVQGTHQRSTSTSPKSTRPRYYAFVQYEVIRHSEKCKMREHAIFADQANTLTSKKIV